MNPPTPGQIYRRSGNSVILVTAIDADAVYFRSWPNGRTAYREPLAIWLLDKTAKCIGHEVRPDPTTGRKGGVFLEDPVSTQEYKQALAAMQAKRGTPCKECEGRGGVYRNGPNRGCPCAKGHVPDIQRRTCKACGGSGKTAKGDRALADALGTDVDTARRAFDCQQGPG